MGNGSPQEQIMSFMILRFPETGKHMQRGLNSMNAGVAIH